MADLKVPRLNRVLIAGRITKELELKYTPKGSPVVNFSVAMDKRFKDESDQWQSVPVYVDQNNVNRKVFEIIADFVQTLEWKPREEGGDTPPPPEEPPHTGSDATNDDVPF